MLGHDEVKYLSREGFIILNNILDFHQVETLRTALECLWDREGVLAGSENYHEAGTRRLASLFNKGKAFQRLAFHPTILSYCRAVIPKDIRLSMINARDSLPGNARQDFHCDTNRSARPDSKGYNACTVIWMLDDFNIQNGATRIIPKTHHQTRFPDELLADVGKQHPVEVAAVGKAGDVLLLNGHVWHCGGENLSRKSRAAILVHYLRADKMPHPDYHRQRPDPAMCRELTSDERALLGLF